VIPSSRVEGQCPKNRYQEIVMTTQILLATLPLGDIGLSSINKTILVDCWNGTLQISRFRLARGKSTKIVYRGVFSPDYIHSEQGKAASVVLCCLSIRNILTSGASNGLGEGGGGVF